MIRGLLIGSLVLMPTAILAEESHQPEPTPVVELALVKKPESWEDIVDPQLKRRDEQIAAWHRENERKKAECDAAGGYIWELECVNLPQPRRTYTPVSNVRPTASVSVTGLVGSIGWVAAGYNCINQPGINNPGWGNPINWPATSYQPWVGATALFNLNHTGVVVGVWGNGDLEIAHQNWRGNQHRFPRHTFRGFR